MLIQAKTQASMMTITEKIKPVLKGTFAFLLVSLSLFHVFFPAFPPELSKNKHEFKKEINHRDSTLTMLVKKLSQKKISINDYCLNINQLLQQSKINIKKINDEKRTINYSFAFRGRSSFRLWLLMFGFVTLGLFFSIKSLYHDITNKCNYKLHFLSFMGVFVSVFWFIHLTFLTHKDFNQDKYLISLIICALLASFFIYYFVKNHTYKDKIIRKLIALILRIKKKYYRDLAIKSMYAEKTGYAMKSNKLVSENIKDFNKDLKDSFKNFYTDI